MNPSRRISPLTLSLVERMATDPASTPQLRAFHTAQLADLRKRSGAGDAAPARQASPFSRFVEALCKETEPTDN